MIETERLRLRTWREEDRAPFAAVNADAEVGYWLGGPISPAESDETFDRYLAAGAAEAGMGRWALVRREDNRLIGAVGFMPVHPAIGLPGVEIGWRLARDAWGHGYMIEAARAALAYGFDHLGLTEVFSFTANTNQRSEAVMRKLGMTRRPELDFGHALLAEAHPLRPHVVYSLTYPHSDLPGEDRGPGSGG